MPTARNTMRTDLVTVRPEATLEEAVRILLENRISGLPVTDADGRLVGVISEFALLAISYDSASRTQSVREHMTQDVISVAPDTPLRQLADTFILHRIRRLPVTDQGRLVGMVSRRELLRAALEAGEPLSCAVAATAN
jgi:YD repeat-containing protein